MKKKRRQVVCLKSARGECTETNRCEHRKPHIYSKKKDCDIGESDCGKCVPVERIVRCPGVRTGGQTCSCYHAKPHLYNSGSCVHPSQGGCPVCIPVKGNVWIAAPMGKKVNKDAVGTVESIREHFIESTRTQDTRKVMVILNDGDIVRGGPLRIAELQPFINKMLGDVGKTWGDVHSINFTEV